MQSASKHATIDFNKWAGAKALAILLVLTIFLALPLSCWIEVIALGSNKVTFKISYEVRLEFANQIASGKIVYYYNVNGDLLDIYYGEIMQDSCAAIYYMKNQVPCQETLILENENTEAYELYQSIEKSFCFVTPSKKS